MHPNHIVACSKEQTSRRLRSKLKLGTDHASRSKHFLLAGKADIQWVPLFNSQNAKIKSLTIGINLRKKITDYDVNPVCITVRCGRGGILDTHGLTAFKYQMSAIIPALGKMPKSSIF